MAETVVGLEASEAYTQLKALLTQKGCRVVAEEKPQRLVAEQGSLWGATPRTAKKTIRFQFSTVDSGTRVTVRSQMSSDYVKFTLFGFVFALALTLVCGWLSLDLAAFANSQNHSFWNWIVKQTDVEGALLLSDLTRAFTIILGAVLALEGFLVAFIHARLSCFAEELLHALSEA